MTAAVPQIFVRNREGKVYGPIEPSTVELLIEGGVLQGMLQVSLDGERYALPFRFPEVRDFFPRHLWGDDNRREVALDTGGELSEESGGAPPPAAEDAGPAVGFGSFAFGEEEQAATDPAPEAPATRPRVPGASPAAPAARAVRAPAGGGLPVLGAPPAAPPSAPPSPASEPPAATAGQPPPA